MHSIFKVGEIIPTELNRAIVIGSTSVVENTSLSLLKRLIGPKILIKNSVRFLVLLVHVTQLGNVSKIIGAFSSLYMSCPSLRNSMSWYNFFLVSFVFLEAF